MDTWESQELDAIVALQAIAERFTCFLENHSLPENVIEKTTGVIKRILTAVHNRPMVRDILQKGSGEIQNIDIALVTAYFHEGTDGSGASSSGTG